MEGRLEAKEEAIKHLQKELQDLAEHKTSTLVTDSNDTKPRTRRGPPPNTEEQECLKKIE
jgi:hypothetical protein